MNESLGAQGAERPPPPAVYRWSVLVFISLAMFGNYYVYDAVSPIADLLKSQLGFSDKNIGTLNAIYSFPNIFMVLLGGIIIDRIGVKRATMLFGVLCFVGAVITVLTGKLAIMASGRLIFGIGAESLIVAVTTALARWFKGKELSFAFGVNLTIARLGSYLALRSPSWAKAAFENWQWPLLISVIFGTLCIVGPLIYWVMEDRAMKRYTMREVGATDKVTFSELFGLGRSYWYVVLLCVTFYSAIFPFQTFAIKFFQEAHGSTREVAGSLSALITLFAMICTPIFGYLVDRVAKRSLFMMFGSLLLVPVYLMMAYADISLWVPMSMMGIAFSLVPAVLWPSVAYIVEERRLGTAYGLMTMIQNIGLFGFNLIIGWANDFSGASPANPGGYALGMWIFSISGFVGFFFAWMLRRAETGPRAHGLETITTKTGIKG
ncbi:MAG: MFS transporter [Candidatus Latescibacteria bacterium]|nr:MFS transporter [Candidatus Latescibacterota bacterium]NIO01057.1 MFS transporter [Candidatus Latescibacterota bacterium]NIO27456.1 MFS transporter [Candidatus Latescibacterota bacterium]NIO54978.1 MFS transporter [Candidatus Latescibacterota bacterium]NIT01067.1 MFS transporter [Candidatus Latescibacterota bacterium]